MDFSCGGMNDQQDRNPLSPRVKGDLETSRDFSHAQMTSLSLAHRLGPSPHDMALDLALLQQLDFLRSGSGLPERVSPGTRLKLQGFL